MEVDKKLKTVREAYSVFAQKGSGCGCGCLCGPDNSDYAKTLGYTDDELSLIPNEANLALSCGNPTALAELREGEVVLDLGSGAGFDCFLAAARVGQRGKVIGVDMTPAMLEKAREIAQKENYGNVEFRLGEIENLPVADNTIDVVISNCVINLSADKSRVFGEILRVLKPGGRVAISDVAIIRELPDGIKASVEAYVSCISGAVPVGQYEELVRNAGLRNVDVTVKDLTTAIDPDTKDPLARAIADSLEAGQVINDYVASVYVKAVK